MSPTEPESKPVTTFRIVGQPTSVVVGQCWAKPRGYWESGNDHRVTPYSGAIVVKTNIGTLVWCNIEQHFDGIGEVVTRYVPVKSDTVPYMDI